MRCTRSGGRPGDELYVSGRIGGGSGRARDAAGRGATEQFAGTRRCIARYRRPAPRVRLGRAVAQARAATAAMDLSDGLADAVAQLAGASGCGVEIDADAVPIERARGAGGRLAGRDPVTAAMTGGDDYELLLAVPRRWQGRLRHATSRVADPPLHRIGVLTKDASARVLVRDGVREPLRQGLSTLEGGREE